MAYTCMEIGGSYKHIKNAGKHNVVLMSYMGYCIDISVVLFRTMQARVPFQSPGASADRGPEGPRFFSHLLLRFRLKREQHIEVGPRVGAERGGQLILEQNLAVV